MINILKSNLIINFILIVKNKIKMKIKFKKKLLFFKDIFYDMINNLTELNFLNYYKDFSYYYSEIILNMNELKYSIDSLINENDINKMKYYKILILRKKILTIMKYVTPKDINTILKLYDLNWEYIYNEEEKQQLELYINYIRPIYLCDCLIHKENNNTNNSPVNDTIVEFNNNLIKNIIVHNIIGVPENKDKIEIHKNDEIKVNNIFDVEDCKYIMGNTNIILQKNKKAISLIENKNKVKISIFLYLLPNKNSLINNIKGFVCIFLKSLYFFLISFIRSFGDNIILSRKFIISK